jgi:protein TonB
MSEQNPQVRRPQTLSSQEPVSPAQKLAGAVLPITPSNGENGAASSNGSHHRPSGIRPLPEMPPGESVAFRHFGVLNAGEQSKATLLTAAITNTTIVVILCLLGLAAKKVHDQVQLVALTEPIPLKKQEQQKPKPKPPVPKMEPPKLIEPPKIEPPKIQVVKLDMPKPVTPTVQMKVPLPVLAAAPLKVNAPAAPKLLSNLTSAASSPNHDAHPAPAMLGSMNNPLQVNPNSRTVSKINMGNSGVPGMPASNSGHGPVSLTGSMGSGAPNGSLGGHAHAAKSIAGLSTGVPGGQGTARTTSAVNIAPMVVQSAPQHSAGPAAGVTKSPTITSKANPQCTQDAKNAHVEGQVALNVVFTTGGSVQVLGVARSLGHGLDESARAAAQAIRFQPATTDGRPVDFKTTILETFACSPQ